MKIMPVILRNLIGLHNRAKEVKMVRNQKVQLIKRPKAREMLLQLNKTRKKMGT
jgi:hypothetical protein